MRFFIGLFNKLLDFIGCIVVVAIAFALLLVIASIVMVGVKGSL